MDLNYAHPSSIWENIEVTSDWEWDLFVTQERPGTTMLGRFVLENRVTHPTLAEMHPDWTLVSPSEATV